MDRNEVINKRYDALMFARTTQQARDAADSLVEVVLGRDHTYPSFEVAITEVCRRLRPAKDPRDQARFEAEFLELVFAPTGGHQANTMSMSASRTKAA